MSVDKRIINYVQGTLGRGYLVEQIKSALTTQGWSQPEIDDTILQVQNEQKLNQAATTAPPAPPKHTNKLIVPSHLSVSQVLLYLGGIIMVLAGIIFVGINWSQWGSIARVFAILLPLLICHAIGLRLWFIEQNKSQGIVLLVVSALLFPFFLSVLFFETHTFRVPFNEGFNLTVSLLSLFLYLIFSYVFKHPIWSLIYQSAGLFAYYSFIQLLGLRYSAERDTMPWLFLVPGILYLYLATLYEKYQFRIQAHYSYVMSTVVVTVAFLQILSSMLHDPFTNTLWLLLIAGIVFFLIGVLLERTNHLQFCLAPYRVGAIIVFLALFRLTAEGSLLIGFVGTGFGHTSNLYGWTNLITGFIFLLIANVLGVLPKYQLNEAGQFKGFYNLVGSFWILAAIFYLGLEGPRPIYETLLLITSLVFIFGSIPKRAKEFLLTGTLFLIVYIFAIGGEYFQDQVGWPITLFATGLTCMGIGIAIEKVRRKYFTLTKS